MNRRWRSVLSCLLLVLPPLLAAESEAPGQKDFTVAPRTTELEHVPCKDCHQYMDPNPEPRQLVDSPHVAEVRHGKADMWCTACHAPENHQQLRALSGLAVDFDDSHRVCRDCHSATYQDWLYGAHGKRVGSWQGEREILNCTACHDPHLNLNVLQRRPVALPGVRAGLERQVHGPAPPRRLWQRKQQAESEESDVTEH
ncbi:MAG: hypothetical protein KFF45_04720 [Thioalkalivibrio sp.]|nr:hypothetical protein [Thioalkalivibrio sp.]